MKVLIAPDSFKGTYSAAQVAAAIASGIESSGVEPVALPVADGGEGTLAALTGPLALSIVEAPACNPWGVPCTGRYGLSTAGTALIEIAEVSGITTPHDGARDALTASTFGTGLLIADAIRRGARRIVVAAGGSATTDGGAGAIEALRSAGVVPHAMTILTDVTTRFVDAARVFAPQKGADAAGVAELTARLSTLASELPRDTREVEGSGAAGGFAGGMWAAFDARIVGGADFVLDASGFDEHVADAAAVIVGEGRLDAQTQHGKIISAILRRTGILPVYAVVGSVGEDLGDYRDRFADVLVATDEPAMRAAGTSVAAALSRL